MGKSKQLVSTGTWVLFLLLLGMSDNLYAQQTSVTGTVTDASNGETLPGVNILVKGTSIGTSTDANGGFEFSVPSLNDTLVVSFVGYQTQEIPINNRTEINVELVSAAIEGEEMVVTALGMMSQRRSLGYAATSIDAESIENFGSSINTMTALYDASPGLQLAQTALGPAGGMAIRVRNALALDQNSNTRPLFVIDGIPALDRDTNIDRSTGTGLNDLNMDDIESIEILRGAKAAVLYGSEGANGVILITTKSGRDATGLGVEVSQELSLDTPVVMQEYQNEFGTGYPAHWAPSGLIDEEGFWLQDEQQSYFPTSLSFGPKMDGRMIPWWDGEQRSYAPQPDNFKDLFRTGSTSKTNFSVQGGGNMGSFRFSYTNRDYTGIHRSFGVLTHNVNLSGNLNLNDRIHLRLNSAYANTFNRNSPARNQNALVTYGINRDLKTGLWESRIVDEENDNYFWWNSDRVEQYQIHSAIRNGVAQDHFWDKQVNRYESQRDHFTQSVTLNIDLTENLIFQALGGMDWISNDREEKVHLTRPLAEGPGGRYQNSLGKEYSFYTQGTLTYNTQLSQDLSLEVLGGGIYQRRASDSQTRETSGGFITRDWFSIENSLTTPVRSWSSRGSDILFGVLGSAQLSYKDWLYLDIQARNDWSSILPPENNSYFYPGTSLAWVFSDVLELPSWVSFGRFRVGLADVGRPGPRYFANELYSIGNYGGTITYGVPGELPPVNLKPERKRELELGAEMSFLNSRLGFEFSYFHSRTYNQIMGISVPPSSGVGNVRLNAGEIRQNGLEFQLRGTPIQTADMQWETVLNITSSKPIIHKLSSGITEQTLWGAQGATVVAREGEPWGQLVINDWRRHENGQKLIGDNGLPDTDPENQIVAGKVLPDFFGGLTNTLNYRNLSLDFGIDFQFGGTLVSQTNLYMIGNGNAKSTLKYRNEEHGGLPYYVDNSGVIVPLDSHDTPVPEDSQYPFIFHDGMIAEGVKADGTTNDQVVSSADYYSRYWRSFLDIQPDVVFKNDYVKLRNVVLGYSFNTSGWLGVDRLRLYTFANNLFYLYNTMPNVGPESLNSTNAFFENNAWPTTRSYGVGIKARF